MEGPLTDAPAETADALVARAAVSTVASLFFAQVARRREAVAIADGARLVTYGALGLRVQKLATLLAERGVRAGERVAVLSENRAEYLEVFLACATVGAIVACQNWRLAPPELAHCLGLVEPKVAFASA